jgi:uncharacterized protein
LSDIFPKLRRADFDIVGAVGRLEVVTSWPEAPASPTVMIVCHPHPLHLGTMNNKVVTTLCRAADRLGWPSVRFNFRGVGNSAGTFSQGVGEQDDVLAVLTWVRAVLPGYRVVLSGFSFGSYVAAAVAQRADVAALISVAPPVHHYDFSSIKTISCPWIVLVGDRDEVVPVEQVRDFVGLRSDVVKYDEFEQCSHFFHGKLIILREAVESWLKVSVG